MFVRFSPAVMWMVVAAGVLATASSAPAKDYFLTIGGGYDPTGNQQSLERNAVFQQNVLLEQRPDKPTHDIFFSDGDDPNRDVQCRDPDFEEKCPAARRMMADIFGDADSADLVYRNHEVPNTRGPAEEGLIRRRMRDIARELKSGDRLLVYVTGHGGPAERTYSEYDYEYSSRHDRDEAEDDDEKAEYNRYDTSYYLWGSESISASQFAAWLDRLEDDVQVVMIMVQCYAGGFAHTIFEQADADLGLSSHARCGFFAQVHDRGAAGCTAEANEADYEEYSSYFWGALAGHTRTGKPITTADYDGNGNISFAEAHSFAVIESDTIDIPVRTTSALLRRYSHLGKESKSDGDSESKSGDTFGRFLGLLNTDQTAADARKFVELNGPLARLAARARPDERAVLEKLPLKLGLNAASTVEDIRRKLKQIDIKGKLAEAKSSAAEKTQSQLLERVQNEVREIWPELNATYSPLAMELTSDRDDEFVERVGKLSSYKALRRATERYSKLSEQQMSLARTEARLQRLIQSCENAVLRVNLPMVAPAEIVARYEKLVAMEEGTLVP